MDPIQLLLMADAEEEARGFDQSPNSENDQEMGDFSQINKIQKQPSSGIKAKGIAAKKVPKTTRSPPKKATNSSGNRKNVMFGSKKERDELILQLLNDTAELKETIDYQKYQIKKTGEFGK